MRGGTIWTILGVIAAVVIAWFLVDGLLHLIWLIARIGIVLVVAAIVYFALRAVFSRPRS
jgi:hypothetical protein